MGRHEKRMREARDDILDWYNNGDVSYAAIARLTGLHISSLRKDGKWNPSGETLVKLAAARDHVERARFKAERKAKRDLAKATA